MELAQTKRIVEALLFVSGEPLTPKRLFEVVPEMAPAELKEAIKVLSEDYKNNKRAFHIQEVAGGYQLVTDQVLVQWVQRLLKQPKLNVVSKAAMETLAIIAYRQPITKAEIETVRGVDVAGALERLVERNLVRMTGRKESPGRPYLYATTNEFLRNFGLKSLEQLPSLENQQLIPETRSVASAHAG